MLARKLEKMSPADQPSFSKLERELFRLLELDREAIRDGNLRIKNAFTYVYYYAFAEKKPSYCFFYHNNATITRWLRVSVSQCGRAC